MKYFFIFLMFTLFLSFKASTDFIFEMDEENKVTCSSSCLIYIKTSDFQNGKEILIKIRADSFLDNQIIYEFVDDIGEEGENTKILDPYDTKNDNIYKLNYYKFKKELANGIQGKYLALMPQCAGEVTVGSTSMPSTQDKDIVKKNSEINVKSSEGGFIFDSSDYNVGDKIYFKIKAKDFYEDNLFYEFFDDLSKYYPKYTYEEYDEAVPTKSENNKTSKIKYYSIQKKNGKYLIAYFDCEGTVTIKNTETDEGHKKISNTTTIVIIVILVIIVIGVFAYYCYRRKKNQGGFCSGNKGSEIEVYNNNEPIPVINNQNPNNNNTNVNYQKINVQNNQKNKKKNNQNQKNIQQNNNQKNQNTPNYNNMNQNTPNYNNTNQNTPNFNDPNNQYTPNYNNMNPNIQNPPMINQNNQFNPNNQMNPNNVTSNNQGYTSVPANQNYTSTNINGQNYDLNIDSNNQFNQNGNYGQMDMNGAPIMGYPPQQ